MGDAFVPSHIYALLYLFKHRKLQQREYFGLNEEENDDEPSDRRFKSTYTRCSGKVKAQCLFTSSEFEIRKDI